MKLVIEKTVSNSPLTLEILRRNPAVDPAYVDSYKSIPRESLSESDWVLIDYHGRFLDKCPGTPEHLCCNYYVLNWAVGCPYACTYCYLHGYKNYPATLIHANVDRLIEEVLQTVAATPDRIFRIGTGEFTDSSALEAQTGFNEIVLPALLTAPNIVIELKTKSNHPATQILPSYALRATAGKRSAQDDRRTASITLSRFKDRLIFAWSMNPPEIIAAEEHSAASLTDRLTAAQNAQTAGFSVALHFDPMIYYADWEAGYRRLVEDCFAALDPKKIAWISMGALRFNPKVKKAALAKFPETKIYYGELVPGVDGKLRYFRPLRVAMFKKMLSWLTAHVPETLIYLCMESPEVWQEVFEDERALGKRTGLFGGSSRI